MDEYGRAEQDFEAQGLPPDLDGAVFFADPVRRLKLLGLAKRDNPASEVWENVFFYGKWTFFISGALLWAVFGLIMRSDILLLLGWALSSLICLPVLLLAFVRRSGGRDSCWHRYTAEQLTLTPGAFVFSMTPRRPKGSAPHVWALPYESITRCEYDRSSKRLRVYGRFDDYLSNLPEPGFLPPGMCRRPEKSRAGVYVDMPMYFSNPEEIIGELRDRTGIYVALRADDAVDLTELQGLVPERNHLRPLLMGFASYTLVFLLTLTAMNVYSSRNPFRPFPPTGETVLSGVFAPGDTVTLDGCLVTLSDLTQQDGNVTVRLGIVNENDIPIGFHWDKNISISAVWDTETSFRCELLEPSGGWVRIDPGGIYEADLLARAPETAPKGYVLKINSDYWYLRTAFWQSEYKGHVLPSGTGMSNVITFAVQLT